MRGVSEQLDMDQNPDSNCSEIASQRISVRTHKQYCQMSCFISNKVWLHFKPEESTAMDFSYGTEAQAGMYSEKCPFEVLVCKNSLG